MATILVVDDSASARQIMRKMLMPEGHEILEAQDGMSALEIYSLEKPDLVTLDLTMGGMHGIEVLKALKKMNPEVKVIVASADIQRLTQQEVLTEGARGFVPKPLIHASVLETVNRVLKGD